MGARPPHLGYPLDAKEAAGTTGIAVVFASLAGFLGRVSVGDLNVALVTVSVIAASVGSLAGSRIMTTRISSTQLKRLISVLLWVVAAKIVWDLATG